MPSIARTAVATEGVAGVVPEAVAVAVATEVVSEVAARAAAGATAEVAAEVAAGADVVSSRQRTHSTIEGFA